MLVEPGGGKTGGFSIPPRYYRDEDFVAQEIQRIFRQSWIGIGRADRLPTSGSYAALDVARQSVILARGSDGDVRAFANTCRHRGARLIDGAGTCNGFACPFHGWSYRLDGSLRAAPQMAERADFDKAANGLIPYRIAERAGFLFLNLDPGGGSLDDHIGGFLDVHAPWPLEDLVSFRRREFDAPCNWKAFLEVFNEYYHLPSVHPSTINSLYDRPNAPDGCSGAVASQFGSTSGTGALLEKAQERSLPPMPGLSPPWVDGVRYSWVFPNMTFAAGRDALWVYEAYPVTATTCHVVQTICFPREAMALADFADRADAYVDRLDAALAEDFPALENQMRGLLNPDAEAGMLHPALEPNVAAFSVWYQNIMQD